MAGIFHPLWDAQDQTLLQVFLNVLEFGMNLQEAVEAPRFNSEAIYSSFGEHRDAPLQLSVEKRISQVVLDQLRARGHELRMQGDWGKPCNPSIVEYDAANKVIRGGADVRGERYALAW